ncbi:MAG: hypothetical protein ACN6I5_00420 [Hyphomicrobiales bacterium]
MQAIQRIAEIGHVGALCLQERKQRLFLEHMAAVHDRIDAAGQRQTVVVADIGGQLVGQGLQRAAQIVLHIHVVLERPCDRDDGSTIAVRGLVDALPARLFVRALADDAQSGAPIACIARARTVVGRQIHPACPEVALSDAAESRRATSVGSLIKIKARIPALGQRRS